MDKNDAVEAWRILVENEFQPVLKLITRQRQKYIKSNKHIAFSKEDILVELHWEMSGYLSGPMTIDHVTKRRNKFLIHNREISNFYPEELLVYLCVHGASHGWSSLEQVCSIAQIIKNKKDLDWDIVEGLASKWRCITMLYLGLYLAWKLLDAPLPDVIIDKIQTGRQVTGLASEVFACMFREDSSLKTKKIYQINFHHFIYEPGILIQTNCGIS